MNFEIAPKSTEVQLNWDDARLYCFSLNIDGKTGWRLPTAVELTEIHNYDNDFGIRGWYWTSSVDIDDRASYQHSHTGYQYVGLKTKVCLVIAIRDLKDNS
jgi:hypothetical protein